MEYSFDQLAALVGCGFIAYCVIGTIIGIFIHQANERDHGKDN